MSENRFKLNSMRKFPYWDIFVSAVLTKNKQTYEFFKRLETVTDKLLEHGLVEMDLVLRGVFS